MCCGTATARKEKANRTFWVARLIFKCTLNQSMSSCDNSNHKIGNNHSNVTQIWCQFTISKCNHSKAEDDASIEQMQQQAKQKHDMQTLSFKILPIMKYIFSATYMNDMIQKKKAKQQVHW